MAGARGTAARGGRDERWDWKSAIPVDGEKKTQDIRTTFRRKVPSGLVPYGRVGILEMRGFPYNFWPEMRGKVLILICKRWVIL